MGKRPFLWTLHCLPSNNRQLYLKRLFLWSWRSLMSLLLKLRSPVRVKCHFSCLILCHHFQQCLTYLLVSLLLDFAVRTKCVWMVYCYHNIISASCPQPRNKDVFIRTI